MPRTVAPLARKKRAPRNRPDTRIEQGLRARGYSLIAGVDEVGRGCLFGPVVAAAVILDPRHPVRGLNDSKRLDAESRRVLSGRIHERAIAVSVAAVDNAQVDRVNIYQASRLAMRAAVLGLDPPPAALVVDALTLDVPFRRNRLSRLTHEFVGRGGVDRGESRARSLDGGVGRGVSRVRAGFE